MKAIYLLLFALTALSCQKQHKLVPMPDLENTTLVTATPTQLGTLDTITYLDFKDKNPEAGTIDIEIVRAKINSDNTKLYTFESGRLFFYDDGSVYLSTCNNKDLCDPKCTKQQELKGTCILGNSQQIGLEQAGNTYKISSKSGAFTFYNYQAFPYNFSWDIRYSGGFYYDIAFEYMGHF